MNVAGQNYKFIRFFPDLSPFECQPSVLDLIARFMVGMGRFPIPTGFEKGVLGTSVIREALQGGRIPAGDNRFGQFIDHDSTLDSCSDRSNPGHTPFGGSLSDFVNLHQPLSDLKAVYDSGLGDDAVSTIENETLRNGKIPMFETGTNSDKSSPFDLPRFRRAPIPDIPDHRNDENLVLTVKGESIRTVRNESGEQPGVCDRWGPVRPQYDPRFVRSYCENVPRVAPHLAVFNFGNSLLQFFRRA